jgi:hypothetical protein
MATIPPTGANPNIKQTNSIPPIYYESSLIGSGGEGAQFSGYTQIYGFLDISLNAIDAGAPPIGSVVIVDHAASGTQLGYRLVAGIVAGGTIWDVPAANSSNHWELYDYRKDGRTLHYNAGTTKFYKEEGIGPDGTATTQIVPTGFTIPPT